MEPPANQFTDSPRAPLNEASSVSLFSWSHGEPFLLKFTEPEWLQLKSERL